MEQEFQLDYSTLNPKFPVWDEESSMSSRSVRQGKQTLTAIRFTQLAFNEILRIGLRVRRRKQKL